MLWQILDDGQHQSFVNWAADNYTPGNEISGTWHPVIQAACVAVNIAKLGNANYQLLDSATRVLKEAPLNYLAEVLA
jgi:hypothetical protein